MEFPLHLLKPDEIARLIVMLPTEHVPRKPFWHKREMRIRPDKTHKPYNDMKPLDRATDDAAWQFYMAEELDRIPRLGILHGPLMADGRFLSQRDRPDNPLIFWNSVPEIKGYTRAMMEMEVFGLNSTKAWLLRRFIRGQVGEAPLLDGAVYQLADHVLDCKIADCKNKFKVHDAMRLKKRRVKASQEIRWENIGSDEATAKAWEHSGFTVRKIMAGQVHWEVARPI